MKEVDLAGFVRDGIRERKQLPFPGLDLPIIGHWHFAKLRVCRANVLKRRKTMFPKLIVCLASLALLGSMVACEVASSDGGDDTADSATTARFRKALPKSDQLGAPNPAGQGTSEGALTQALTGSQAIHAPKSLPRDVKIAKIYNDENVEH